MTISFFNEFNLCLHKIEKKIRVENKIKNLIFSMNDSIFVSKRNRDQREKKRNEKRIIETTSNKQLRN